jgi:RNA polymerase sigma factor (sigma-70 family)
MSLSLFSKYISEIGGVPLLTPEREAQLGRIIQAGIRPEATEHQKRAGEEAQYELIQKNLKLVVSIAKHFLGGASTLEEMTSDGNQGLTKAATRYNPAFKTRFSTYATWWIRQAIQEGLYRAHTIRMPGRRARLLRKIRHSRSFNDGARDQDLERIEKETDIPRETIIRVLNDACTFVSFNAPPHDGDESLEAAIDSGSENPAAAAMEVEESRMLCTALSELGPVERHVVSARFGLNGETRKTLDSLAATYGVSCECIRQIEKRALRMLKRKLAGANVV